DSPLADYHQYEWYVQALVSNGGATTPSPPSQVRFFLVSPIGQPTLVSPQPGAIVTTATPTLEAAVSGVDSPYLSLFDITANLPVITDFIPEITSYTLGVPLENGHTYAWSAFTSRNGPTAEFTVSLPNGGTESLAAPTLTPLTGILSTDTPT